MAIAFPAPVAGYFAADKSADADALARVFTEDATVRDEGHSYRGRAAIRRWKTESSSKYVYTVQPFAIAEEAGLTIVTAHLAGDFPGSPIDLRYRFALNGDLIGELEVVP